MLGITIDNKLKFKSHVKNLCNKGSQKIWASSLLTNYLSNSEKKTTFNAIIKFQFSYCPLGWMFCSKQTNKIINKLHESALKLLLNNHVSDFELLLCKSNDILSS